VAVSPQDYLDQHIIAAARRYFDRDRRFKDLQPGLTYRLPGWNATFVVTVRDGRYEAAVSDEKGRQIVVLQYDQRTGQPLRRTK